MHCFLNRCLRSREDLPGVPRSHKPERLRGGMTCGGNGEKIYDGKTPSLDMCQDPCMKSRCDGKEKGKRRIQ